MREILFRGKPLGKLHDNFIYGSLGVICEDLCAIYHCHEFIDDDIQLVDIGTVGQYTGLTDKNGKKIFEGDIVKAPDGEIFKIEWHSVALSWILRNKKSSCLAYLRYLDMFEIIGNIHDNPELLKEADNE